MRKKLIMALAGFCVLALALPSLAGMPQGTQVIISYDGYLQQTYEPPPITITADTLIVVTNSHPSKAMYASIEVFDKYGTSLGTPVPFLNGGNPWSNSAIPGNAYGWVTLGQIVNRGTERPDGQAGAEKFSFRIYTTLAAKAIPPVVEVKQVIYNAPLEGEPGDIIWNVNNFRIWTETSLGGLNGTGIVKSP